MLELVLELVLAACSDDEQLDDCGVPMVVRSRVVKGKGKEAKNKNAQMLKKN